MNDLAACPLITSSYGDVHGDQTERLTSDPMADDPVVAFAGASFSALNQPGNDLWVCLDGVLKRSR